MKPQLSRDFREVACRRVPLERGVDLLGAGLADGREDRPDERVAEEDRGADWRGGVVARGLDAEGRLLEGCRTAGLEELPER